MDTGHFRPDPDMHTLTLSLAYRCRTLLAFHNHRASKARLLLEGRVRVDALRLRSYLAAWRGEQQRQRAKGRLRELMASWRRQAVLRRCLLGEIRGPAGIIGGGTVEVLGARL